MFRPEIKVLDCTIRDGGLMNNWKFEERFVKDVFNALGKSGVDIMEIGYLSSEKQFSRKENGPWKFCTVEDMRRIVGDTQTDMKIGALADIGRIEYEDIPEKNDSPLDVIRVACYAKDTDKAIDLAHHCMEKGYEACVQLMAVSKVIERDLDEALNDLSKSRVSAVYIVDSFGALWSEQIHYLVKKYMQALPGKTIGFHGHNNQQLAFANSIEAIRFGANQIDATLFGIGRAAGNCPLELIMSFLKNPKFNLKPILEVIEKDLLTLQQKLEWGYHIPYMITGALNEHPRSAMKFMATENRAGFKEFFERLVEPETLE
jgi:4-hydroxy 2-oxovalerate aldolase